MRDVKIFLAEQLRGRRKQAKLSQEKFAELSGLSLALINSIERTQANPTLETLHKIATFFDLTIAELLDASDFINDKDHIKAEITNNINRLSMKQLRILYSLIQFKTE
jgi:transcriptional regulator with XRE-family HTH domain